MIQDNAGGPCVLVLASGRGERFRASGGQVHKLQALLEGRTVLERTLDAVRASGLPWHLEDRGHPGMGDSIAAAVRAAPSATGWLVLPGDLPLVRPETLRSVAEALRHCTVAVPVYQGQRGHPVGFGAVCGEELKALTGERGAASIVQGQARAGGLQLVAVEDEGTVADIDTVEALERAAALWRGRR
jgi:molybdenum cofactor cytidylyltransferase